MATAHDLRRLALALEGTSEAPHFDRAAFKVARIYVTLAADGRTANFKFTSDEQEFKCMLLPAAFTPIPNAWGRQGWTTAMLSQLTTADLKAALAMAWQHAQPKTGKAVGRAKSKTDSRTSRTNMAKPKAVTIYGIKNCDTMKKARAWLDGHGVAYAFHDYKTAGIEREALEGWAGKVGWEVLLNRAGTTFRALPDKDKQGLSEKKAITLMLAQPSLIKRPVLDIGGKLLVGFKPEQYEATFAG